MLSKKKKSKNVYSKNLLNKNLLTFSEKKIYHNLDEIQLYLENTGKEKLGNPVGMWYK